MLEWFPSNRPNLRKWSNRHNRKHNRQKLYNSQNREKWSNIHNRENGVIDIIGKIV